MVAQKRYRTRQGDISCAYRASAETGISKIGGILSAAWSPEGLASKGTLMLRLIGWVTGIDVLSLMSGGQTPTAEGRLLTEAARSEGEFAAGVLATTAQAWA